MIARLLPVLLLIGAWWPSRISGLLDGAPLDNAPDAIVLGLFLPILLWLAPAAFTSRRARIAIIALIAWKAFGAAMFVQDGWCARVEPTRPYVMNGTGAPKNWDVRADWRSADPQCSAIATAPYLTDEDFPVWFFNLPSATPGEPAAPADVPPLAVTHLAMHAIVRNDAAGVFQVRSSANVPAELRVDGRVADVNGVRLEPGSHDVAITATLKEMGWSLEPLWNGRDAFAALPASIAPPSTIDRVFKPWAQWIPFALVSVLVLMGTLSLWNQIAAWEAAAWIVLSAAAGGAIFFAVPPRYWQFPVFAISLAAAFVPVPATMKTLRGAFILLAPSWLALHIVDTYRDIGFNRMQVLMSGNDWWTFQRYAYRIFMQGYWLEGGEITFKFRPLYRWIAGAIHMLFGQSQTGENYWDAIGILIFALFAFEVVRRLRDFRWGIVAGALTLASFLSGPGHVFIGRGLSEITSAGFLYLSVLCVISARASRSTRLLIAAGVFAVFGAWTRENNLPMALGVTVFAWSLDVPASVLWKPRRWFDQVWWPAVIAIPVAVAVGMTLFALRTWHYTGSFSLRFGSQIDALAVWLPGMNLREALASMVSSVMMVATTTDPPRFHTGAIPVLAGTALSVAALLGVPYARRLPLALVAWTMSGYVSYLIARGNAYSGRFSVHVVGATAAVVICAIAALLSRQAESAAIEHRANPPAA